jgi:uncharacterized membrane protein YhaH (DUF805 family)
VELERLNAVSTPTIWMLLFLAPVALMGIAYLAALVVVVWASIQPERPEDDRFR